MLLPPRAGKQYPRGGSSQPVPTVRIGGRYPRVEHLEAATVLPAVDGEMNSPCCRRRELGSSTHAGGPRQPVPTVQISGRYSRVQWPSVPTRSESPSTHGEARVHRYPRRIFRSSTHANRHRCRAIDSEAIGSLSARSPLSGNRYPREIQVNNKSAGYPLTTRDEQLARETQLAETMPTRPRLLESAEGGTRIGSLKFTGG